MMIFLTKTADHTRDLLKRYGATLLFLTATQISTVQAAASQELSTTPALSFTFSDPSWQLIINNQVLNTDEVKITSAENSFARSIRPLLKEQDYRAVQQAFAKRDIAEDSTALKLMRGQVCLMLKERECAEQAFTLALAQQANLAKAHQGLSMLYMLEKNYAKAQIHLVKSIELGVADAQLFAQLAYVNSQNKQFWAAIAGYQQALFLAPDNQQYQQGLLHALIQSGDFNQANNLLEQLISEQPNNAQLWLHRSQIALQRQQFNQALSSAEVALRLDNSNSENILLNAQLHMAYGSPQRALDLLTNALKNPQQISPLFELSDNVLNWLNEQKQWSAANKLLTLLNQQKKQLNDTQLAKLYLYQGRLAIQNKQNNQAEKHLLDALTINPTLGSALMSLASIYQESGRYQQAKTIYVRAQSLPEQQENALLGQAQLAINEQNYRAALDLLRQVLKLNPSRNDLFANIRSLEKLVRHES